MKKRILIIGSKGCLGSQLMNTFKSLNLNCIGISRKDVDVIKDIKKLRKIILKYKPNYIFNCIAVSGLLFCENKAKLAYEVNTNFPLKLVDILDNTNAKLIHFSTEAVFKGNIKNKLYNEKDIPNPTSIYGKSKLLSEKFISKYSNSLTIRLPVLFGPTHKDQIVDRLLKKILSNQKILAATDVFSTPVYSPDLSKFIFFNILRKDFFLKKKLIHYSSNKYLSIYELINKISKKIKKKYLIKGVKDSFFGKNKIKPKYLGLKSIYKGNISSIDYENINKFY